MNFMFPKKNKLITDFFISSSNIDSIYFISSVFLMLISCLPPFRALTSISASLKGYYYVNYFDLGFIKRGLIGSIYKIFNLQNYLSPSILVLCSHVIFLILFAAIFWKYVPHCFYNFKFKDKIFFYTLFLLSPVLFLRLGYDIGRMDLICLVLSLLNIIIIQNDSYSFFKKSLFISLNITIQLLIHEGSLLMYTPLVLTLYFYKCPQIKLLKSKKYILLFSLPLIVGLFLLIFGRYEMGSEDLNLYLKSINEELDTSMGMELIYTLKQNFHAGFSRLSLYSLFGGNYFITTYYIFILYLTFRFSKLPLYIKLTIFSPLILSFIAMDHTRFTALSAICCNLIFIISAKELKLFFTNNFRFPIYVFLIAIFFLGPWGIGTYDPLPLLKHY